VSQSAFNIQQVASGTATNLGAATEIELVLGTSVKTVQIDRVKVKHTGGSAANIAPRIHSATGGLAAAYSQEFAADSVAVASICDVAADGVICTTDAAGKLYLIVAPDAGSNNAASYAVAYRVLA
jgi:hypothetical protein